MPVPLRSHRLVDHDARVLRADLLPLVPAVSSTCTHGGAIPVQMVATSAEMYAWFHIAHSCMTARPGVEIDLDILARIR